MPNMGSCFLDPAMMHHLFSYQWNLDPPDFFVFISFILFLFRFLFPMREVHPRTARFRHLTRRHSMTGCHAMSRIASIASRRSSWLPSFHGGEG